MRRVLFLLLLNRRQYFINLILSPYFLQRVRKRVFGHVDHLQLGHFVLDDSFDLMLVVLVFAPHFCSFFDAFAEVFDRFGRTDSVFEPDHCLRCLPVVVVHRLLLSFWRSGHVEELGKFSLVPGASRTEVLAIWPCCGLDGACSLGGDVIERGHALGIA